MGAEESFCQETVEKLQIPTSLDEGLQLNLKIHKNELPSRNYARRATQRPRLSERVQQTIRTLLQCTSRNIVAEPLKMQEFKGHDFPCFYILKKKVFYLGQWLNGLPHGKGRVYFPNGCFFEGWFNQGEAQGSDNIFIYSDGSFYRGAFKSSKKHGFGKFIFYRPWQNDKPHGLEGIQKYPDGSRYIGGFVNGLKEGQGQYFWPDGKVYFGQFKNGNMQGKGTLKKGKDSYFQGLFEKNNKQGRGTLKTPFGIYEGTFNGGVMSGQGVFKWNDGRMYKGSFKNGKMHGNGTVVFPNGRCIVGEWEDGENIQVYEILNRKKN